jgi:hypothetical protein
MTIRFLNPMQPAEVVAAQMAPRLAGLRGTTVGLLSNGKANATRLLAMIGEELGTAYGVEGVIEDIKLSASSNCPAAILDGLRGRCDAVITGNGD